MTERFDLEQLDLFQNSAGVEENRFAAVVDHFIGAEAACVLARLFWPQFIEYRDGVYLDFAFDEDSVDQWLEGRSGDVVEVERVVNHTHLWDLFHETSSDVPGEALDELGEVLAQCWRCAVREAFPDRDFVIAVEKEPDDYGPTLYLYTKRD